MTTRILDRRRLVTPSPASAPRRPRAALAADVSARLRVSRFGVAYLVVAVIVGCLILYLFEVAQVTKVSYQIGRLRAQQAQLESEQQQLRYQEASLTAPARIQQDAAKSGMERAKPSQYVAYQPVQVDLNASPPPQPRDQPPLWQRAVAAVVRALS